MVAPRFFLRRTKRRDVGAASPKHRRGAAPVFDHCRRRSLNIRRSSALDALGWELVATDNVPIFDATPAYRWNCCNAEAAPVSPDASLFFDVTRKYLPGAGFQHVEYLPASSVHRNRSQAAEVNGGQ